jgi:hypothetical protein
MLTKRQKYTKKWWQKNKDRIRATLRSRPDYRYKSLKLRCKRDGLEFDISYPNYLKKIQGGCYYCGADVGNEIGGGMDRRNNNNRKYNARNLVCCCAPCNKIKSNQLTEKEMLVVMKALKKYRGRKK